MVKPLTLFSILLIYHNLHFIYFGIDYLTSNPKGDDNGKQIHDGIQRKLRILLAE